MQRIHFEPTAAFLKAGRLSWLLDSALIIGAAFAAASAVIPLGMWWHRSHNPDLTLMTFQASVDPDTAEAQAGPTGTPLLWVLKKADSTVYLFGAFNSSDPIDSGWMDRRLYEAFDNADQALFEVPSFPVILPSDPIMPHPDAFLFQRAQSLRMTVGGLESGDYAGRVSAAGVSDDGFVLPVSAWRTGDQKTLTDSLALMAQADPAGYAALIDKRNQTWLPAIRKALSNKGTTFVTVGATHLIGPDGLVAALRQSGYSVSRLDAVTPGA
ncbi:MAG: TraB/GumN family protein [Asticcacaulis sp.]|uniref:TraB/GumN family protein n=1 Tax=Asticcacaulis sp. TaxID=1872648 RepID=UPI0039E5FA9D